MVYTYLWLREDGTPYYVGKGIDRRAYKSCKGHRPPKDRTRIIVQEFLSNDEACFAERFLIALYGRKDLSEGCLINLTDGGDGVIRHRHTEQTRLRMAGNQNAAGKQWSSESRQRIAGHQPSLGKKWSEAAKLAWAKKCLNRKPTLEARRKMSLAKIGNQNARRTCL